MTSLAVILVTVLVIWMSACAACGYRSKVWAFVVVLVLGLGMNMAWMMIGLDARALEPHALIAQASVALYGCSAFGFGWLLGRVRRAWRESAVS